MTDMFRQEVEESIHPTHVGLECNTLTHTHAQRKLASDVLEEYEMYFKVQSSNNHSKTEHVQRESGVKEKYLYSVNRQVCCNQWEHWHAVTFKHSRTGTPSCSSGWRIQCVAYSKWFTGDRLSQQQKFSSLKLASFAVILSSSSVNVWTSPRWSGTAKISDFSHQCRWIDMCLKVKQQDVKWTGFIVLLFLEAAVT